MRYLPIFTLFFVISCAHAWKRTYVAASVTKTLVTETHKKAWSEPLNKRLEECQESETTQEDFDDCMGIFNENEKVVHALKAYHIVAEKISTLLTSAEPGKLDKQVLRDSRKELISLSFELFRLFPNSAKYQKTLQELTKGF